MIREHVALGQRLAGWIAAQDAHGRSSVMSCSALRRSHREVLRTGAPNVVFVHLDGDSAAGEDVAGRHQGFGITYGV
jgi:gluconokinase